MTKDKLIVFAKKPVAGKVKTRLQPVFSENQSLALHKHLIKYTLQSVADLDNTDIELCCMPDAGDSFFERCQKQFKVHLTAQTGADLGERMHNAIDKSLPDYQRVIIIGTDCPSMSKEYITNGFRHLERNEIVIGPAHDGGYVLIGMKHSYNIFSQISWGSDSVLTQTRDKIRKLALIYSELNTLGDIDRPADLEAYPELIDIMHKGLK